MRDFRGRLAFKNLKKTSQSSATVQGEGADHCYFGPRVLPTGGTPVRSALETELEKEGKRPDRNSGSRDVCRCSLEVLHRAMIVYYLLPRRRVSRPAQVSETARRVIM